MVSGSSLVAVVGVDVVIVVAVVVGGGAIEEVVALVLIGSRCLGGETEPDFDRRQVTLLDTMEE